MSFQELMTQRYSVRKFTDQPISPEDMALLLESARVAPTAANLQPQRIYVAQTAEDHAKIDLCTSCRFGAPVVFIICYDADACWVRSRFDQKTSGEVDASIVTTHMMLQAQALGLGTTWVMHFNPEEAVRQFNLPDNIIPIALLPTGHPAPDAKPSEKHGLRMSVEDMLL